MHARLTRKNKETAVGSDALSQLRCVLNVRTCIPRFLKKQEAEKIRKGCSDPRSLTEGGSDGGYKEEGKGSKSQEQGFREREKATDTKQGTGKEKVLVQCKCVV